MKKIFLAVALFSTFLGFSSCGDEDDEDKKAPISVDDLDSTMLSAYEGTMTVVYAGEDYVSDKVQSTCKINDENDLTIGLIDVKFVPQMPITISLEIPSVPYEKENGTITFQADSIVPTMGGNPFDRYVAKNLKGTISKEGVITYSLSFGTYPTSYTGKLQSK